MKTESELTTQTNATEAVCSTLDHLRRIDAHLANLLSTAEKRTPGEWSKTNYHHANRQVVIRTGIGDNDAFPGDRKVCDIHHSSNSTDADFIASCAGNAEAGWRATRAAIACLLVICDPASGADFTNYGGETFLPQILEAFPNI